AAVAACVKEELGGRERRSENQRQQKMIPGGEGGPDKKQCRGAQIQRGKALRQRRARQKPASNSITGRQFQRMSCEKSTQGTQGDAESGEGRREEEAECDRFKQES